MNDLPWWIELPITYMINTQWPLPNIYMILMNLPWYVDSKLGVHTSDTAKSCHIIKQCNLTGRSILLLIITHKWTADNQITEVLWLFGNCWVTTLYENKCTFSEYFAGIRILYTHKVILTYMVTLYIAHSSVRELSTEINAFQQQKRI